jgi:type IV secretory pathway TrbL component
VLLANAVKLLGLYLVVAAGSKTISTVANSIPTSAMSLDGYVWISVSVLLFWLVAKNVPNQLASIVSGSLQASRGTSVAALAITAGQQGRLAMAAGAKIMGAAQGIAKIAGSTLNNAASRFNGAMDKTGSAGLGAIGAAAGAVGSLAKSTGGNVADHFKNVGSKMAGGPGRSVAGVSERLYKDAQGQKAKASPPKGPRVT